MFLYKGFFYAALLWLAIVLITRDKEGSDYWECVPWIATSLVAIIIVRALAYSAGLADGWTWILHTLAGLGVLWFFVNRSYGRSKGIQILIAYFVITIMVTLPRWLVIFETLSGNGRATN